MKIKFAFIFTIISIQLFAQIKKPDDFGFTHLQTFFKGDTIDILMLSKKGDSFKKKPLFFFCQGSLPVPLIKTAGKNLYEVFPFSTDSIIEKYHLIIVSKPFIPLVVDASVLVDKFCYVDQKTGKFPLQYSKRNLPDYYVKRNLQVIDFLQKQKFVSNEQLVVAGHSQGGRIAAGMALSSPKVTHLIYASENPFGQIMNTIEEYRDLETDTDSTRYCDDIFKYWEKVVKEKENMNDTEGDTYKATYDFSIPSYKYLCNLKIPVLVCYGTKDPNASFNDYLHVEVIRQHRKNFAFKSYIGRDHNYFGFKSNGQIDFDNFGWNIVATDWMKWLGKANQFNIK